MSDSSLTPASAIHDIVRIVLSTALDRAAYGLLRFMYELFFNVASADIFSNDTVMNFYGRIQLILGVFMMFQLAMIIIRGIANPDNFFGGEKGAGNLLKRVCVSLFLLVALVPINIPVPRNEYEHQLNNNGLLFGTLYSLQYRLLSNNTLGKLILGNNDESYNYTSDSPDATKNLRKSSRIFASTILKGFYKINLIPDEQDANGNDIRKHADDKTDDMITDNRICQEDIDEIIAVYKQDDVDPQDIISMVNETCAGDGWVKMPEWTGAFGTWLERRGHNNFYVFAYTGFISAIVGFIFAFILLSFSIDVAVRAIKLAVLRLIAPIPIITYMDPKGSKDGAFNAWVKTLTSTYIDLFVRLAVVYFVIFLIQDMMTNGISINSGSGIVGGTSYIIIWIGLFIFAKQAPKFFRKVLGLKEDAGFKLFGGIGDAMAIGSIGAGAVSGSISRALSSYGKDQNVGKALLSGIGGAFGGLTNAGKSYFTGKDANAKSIMNANRAYASKTYSNAADESTPWGRFKAGAQANLGMKNDLQKMDDKIKYYGAAESAMGRINKAFDGNGDAKIKFNGDANGNSIVDSHGNTLLRKGDSYSLKDYNDILNRVNASGDAKLIEAVDSAKKTAQGERFNEIRKLTREQVEHNIATGVAGWSTNDLVVYDSAKTIHDVAQKYSSEAEFSHLAGTDFHSSATKWGPDWKHDAGQAGKSADQIKNSDAYAQAKANAQRAEDKNKK